MIGVGLKSNIIISLGCILLSQFCFAESLVISGTVPDRGFSASGLNTGRPEFSPQENTNVKVFIANLVKSSRSPQSVVTDQNSIDFSSVNGWKKLSSKEVITVSSYIKVVAP